MEEQLSVPHPEQVRREYPQRNLRRLRVSRILFNLGWMLLLASMIIPCGTFQDRGKIYHNYAFVPLIMAFFGLVIGVGHILRPSLDAGESLYRTYSYVVIAGSYYFVLANIWRPYWQRSQSRDLWFWRLAGIALFASWTPEVHESMCGYSGWSGGGPRLSWDWGYALWLAAHLLIALSPWVCPARLEGEPASPRVVLKRARRGDPIFDAEYAANRMRAFPVVESSPKTGMR